ncbi:MAG: putative xylanase/chitin deacetylase [Segetibacter sp.]|nr:putative xylanase/chitin deacetylase [Segetibacter sp.]
MKHFPLSLLFLASVITFSCKNPVNSNTVNTGKDSSSVATGFEVKDTTNYAGKTVADAATILAKKEVPVLCYHQIRDWSASDSKSSRDYIIPVDAFKSHLKILADSGYHTILPDQLYNYLAYGAPLPEKPVMLTFDDTDDDQFTIGASEMKKYGFKGVFFIMTVSINRPKYMTTEQIKQLANEGHVIESHTWDHHNVKQYKTEQDWVTQIEKPKKKIEELVGKTSEYFAYPFGLWNREAIPELKKRGVKSAYILSTKRDPDDPLYTIRRIIASGFWSGTTMYKSMLQSFH